MKRNILWAFALLLLGTLLLASNWYHPNTSGDFAVRNGHLYTQGSNVAGHGFRITDDGAVPFWSEYERLGGAQALGYPISRRFVCGGDLCQATAKEVLRWHGQGGEGNLTHEPITLKSGVLTVEDGSSSTADGALAAADTAIPPTALQPEPAEDTDTPDLPVLSPRAQQVADAARPAVVKIQLGPDEFGSGIIYDPEGYIITNQHVVEGFQRVVVLLTDGRQLKGTVLGTDEANDVAVVKVSADNLPALPLGDSSTARVGDEIVVLGYTPMLGDAPVARTGIVRFTGRIPGHSFLPDAIQTDAFVHPGDSGGPLLNLRGEVIGLNEAMLTSRRSPGVVLANAVTSNIAKASAEQIVNLARNPAPAAPPTPGPFGPDLSVPNADPSGPNPVIPHVDPSILLPPATLAPALYRAEGS